jgi:hypothetical protein
MLLEYAIATIIPTAVSTKNDRALNWHQRSLRRRQISHAPTVASIIRTMAPTSRSAAGTSDRNLTAVVARLACPK